MIELANGRERLYNVTVITLALLLFLSFLAVMTGLYAWTRRESPGARPLAMSSWLTAFWSLAYALALVLEQPTLKLLMTQFYMSAYYLIPSFWMALVLQLYRGRPGFVIRGWLFLLAEPLAMIALLWTNPLHGWLYSSWTWDQVYGLGLPVLRFSALQTFHLIYTFILMVYAGLILFFNSIRTHHAFKWQIVPLLLSFFLGPALQVLGLFHDLPQVGIHYSPYLFIMGQLFIVLSLYRFRFLDLAPVSYDLIVDNLVDGIVVLDSRERIVEINPAARAILDSGKGIPNPGSPQSPVGTLLRDWNPSLDLLVQNLQSSLLWKNSNSAGETWIDKSHSPQRYYSLGLRPMGLPWMSRGGYLLILRDISDQVQTDRALVQTEGRYQKLFNEAYDAILIENENGLILEANPAAGRLLGYSPGEFRQMPAARLYAQSQIQGDRFLAFQNQSGDKPDHVTLETQFLHKSGHQVPVEIILTPLQEDQQCLYLSIVRDASDRQKTQETLRRAIEGAEEANRAKSSFIANISHEIRTPLNAVVGMTNLLLGSELPAEEKEYIRIIRKSSTGLLSLINDVLDLSKIEAKKFELENRPFHLRSLLEESLDLVAPRAGSKTLDLQCRIHEDLAETYLGDDNRLKQILLNLLGNAVKFTPGGQVFVEVRPGGPVQNRPGGGRVRSLDFSIRDTGIGIPTDQLDRVFQTFTQLDSSTTREYGGSGLGLAICRQLCELMGGKIWAQSRPGEGSTFRFRIPLEEIRDHNLPQHLKKHNFGDGKDAVLYLSQSPFPAQALESQLRLYGLYLISLSNLDRALKLVQNHRFIKLIFYRWDTMPAQGDDYQKLLQLADTRKIPFAHLGTVLNTPKERLSSTIPRFGLPLKTTVLYRILEGIYRGMDLLDPVDEEIFLFKEDLALKYPLRILIAEDNLVNQQVAVLILQRLGYDPQTVLNGREAVVSAKQSHYDLILMDDHMPVLDGLSAAAEIRSSMHLEHQPCIVAVTANALPDSRKRYLEGGMDDYLQKPINLKELKETLIKAHEIKYSRQKSIPMPQLSIPPEKPLFPRNTPYAPAAPAAPAAPTAPPARSEPQRVSENPEDHPSLDRRAWDRTKRLMDAVNEGEFDRIKSLYLRDTPLILESLERALGEGNWFEVQNLSHTLKSTSQQMGGRRLAQFALEMEHKSRDGQVPQAEERLVLMKKEYQRFVKILQGEQGPEAQH